MSKEIVGFMVALNGDKKKCSNCNRTHGRTFVVKDSDSNQLEFYGSGCIQKVVDPVVLAKALSKVTVQTARLSMELINNIEELVE